MRSELTIDLDAVRHNARRLIAALEGAELWAVVKADAYGHGAEVCGRAALEAGAEALCVASAGEGAALRTAFPEPRILVMSPADDDDVAQAREAKLELMVSGPPPPGVTVHVKLDSGMGRWGLSELVRPERNVVGLATHLATADTDLDFARAA